MLKTVLGPMHTQAFFSEYWGRNAVVLESDIDKKISFRKKDFFHLLKTCELEFPRVTCINHEGRLPIEQYVDISPKHISAKIAKDKIGIVAENGNTVRIRKVAQFNESIEALAKEAVRAFQFDVTVNAYYTSSPSDGFNPHYDIRHTFILQLEGKKQWSLGDQINQVPRHEFRPFHDQAYYTPKKTFFLNAGEVLYIPPGLWHKTKTLAPEYSLHLAVGIALPDWYDVMQVALRHAMEKYPIFREHIPFSVKEGTLDFQTNLTQQIIPLIELMKKDLQGYDLYTPLKQEVDKKPK